MLYINQDIKDLIQYMNYLTTKFHNNEITDTYYKAEIHKISTKLAYITMN